MLSFGEYLVLGLSRDCESIDGPARVEIVMDREAAAVCRSRAGRAKDAIFFFRLVDASQSVLTAECKVGRALR